MGSGEEFFLFRILNKKKIDQVVEKAAGESGVFDKVDGFKIDEFAAEDFADEEKRRSDAGAAADKNLGFFVDQDF